MDEQRRKAIWEDGLHLCVSIDLISWGQVRVRIDGGDCSRRLVDNIPQVSCSVGREVLTPYFLTGRPKVTK